MDQRFKESLRKFASTGDLDAAGAACAAYLRSQGEENFGSVVRIPTIGTRITLTEDWTFNLVAEGRNEDFHDKVHLVVFEQGDDGYLYEIYKDKLGEDVKRRYSGVQKVDKETTLPAGTVLRVDRLYIKKNQGEFDSVTFICETLPGVEVKLKSGKKAAKVGRFWAKLRDVNNIVGCWDSATLKVRS